MRALSDYVHVWVGWVIKFMDGSGEWLCSSVEVLSQ